MSSIVVFVLCVFYVLDPSVGLQCKSGYEIELMGQKNETSVDCQNGACMRIQGLGSVEQEFFSVESKVFYWGCHPISDCFSPMCESVKEKLRLPLQSQGINLDDVETKECKVACCDSGDDCNTADVELMELVTTTLAKTTTPSTTSSKITGTMETAVNVSGSSNITPGTSTTSSSRQVNCASAFLLVTVLASTNFI